VARQRLLRLLRALPLLLLIAVTFSGCRFFDSPQNVFAPAGEVSRDQKNLFFQTMWPALAILILVEGGLLFICLRFAKRKGDSTLPRQVHGNNALEIGWTIAPMLLLAAFVPPTVVGIIDLGRVPKDAMVVKVTGVQWAWQFSYPGQNGAPDVLAPINELHVPIGTAMNMRLHSNDVIHSFWVPKLAGKTDVIPGRENHMWLRATEIGEFSGQCAEFCGLGHAQMRFRVIVESQADFQAWLQQQAAIQDGHEADLAYRGSE